jgi:hypothetical protein
VHRGIVGEVQPVALAAHHHHPSVSPLQHYRVLAAPGDLNWAHVGLRVEVQKLGTNMKLTVS